MDKVNKSLTKQNTSNDEKNRQYVFIDAVGRKHVLRAGKDGVTQKWIAIVRHDECEEICSNYHYYFRWDGSKYEPRILSTDTIPPDKLEYYPSMSTSRDALSILVEQEEQAIFYQKLQTVMQSLTSEQKQLIHQKNNLKMSDVEISRQEGVSASAIRRRWIRLMKRLCKLLR